MNLLALSMLFTGGVAMCMKIYMHFKLIDPQRRTIGQLGRQLGLNFFFPITTKYNSSRLEHRKINANRLLAVFYSCAILAIVFTIIENPD